MEMPIEPFLKKAWKKMRFGVSNEEVLCTGCLKPLLGYSFRHPSKAGPHHSSCIGVATKTESLLLHFSSRHKALIFTEELQNKGKVDAVCLGCEEPVEGPGYECSVPDCVFLLHESCAKLSPETQHPLHPNHTLSLQLPQQICCNSCGIESDGCFYYGCRVCSNTNLHIRCATRWRTTNYDDCQHEFRFLFRQFQYICDACGEEGKYLAAQCNKCQLLIHNKCSQFSRTIRTRIHSHILALTYSLRLLKVHDQLVCRLCFEKVNMEYGAYFCKSCCYVAHLDCAYQFIDSVWVESVGLEGDVDEETDGGGFESEESVGLESDVEEEIHEREFEVPVVIKHFSHQHPLILGKEEFIGDKLCDGCLGLMAAPFYRCKGCNFFLHRRCALLPRKKKHPLHEHQLTLVSRVPYFGGVFLCNACYREGQGFSFNCATCQFDLDIQCCSVPKILKSQGPHPHNLFFAVIFTRKCKACDRNHGQKEGGLVCIICDFALCLECATLPAEASHKYDKHPLKLEYNDKDNSGEYYCLICEKERNPCHRFYHCKECDFPAHIECVIGRFPYMKIGSIFVCEDHEHPLAFVEKDEFAFPCQGCGQAFPGIAVECTRCELSVHDKYCLSTIRHRPVPTLRLEGSLKVF